MRNQLLEIKREDLQVQTACDSFSLLGSPGCFLCEHHGWSDYPQLLRALNPVHRTATVDDIALVYT